MQYKVVFEHAAYMEAVVRNLEKEVSALCKEGWKPQGGISMSTSEFNSFDSQAMVKE